MKEQIRNDNLKQYSFRAVYYIFGLLILALGITLNTKTLLGVSAIISVPYTISEIGNFNFGNATFVAYVVMVLAQFIIKGKNRTLVDLLQIPLSIVFTRFLNVYNDMLNFPNLSVLGQAILLIIAVVLTGIGAAVTVNMKLIANPGDAIVSAIADRINKPMGFTKNVVDISCVIISVTIGMVCTGAPLGVGVGTLFSMIGVGRVIAVFNKLFKEGMELQAGVMDSVSA